MRGRPPKLVPENPKDPKSRKVPRERPGSKYDMEISIGRMGKILDIVRGNDKYRSVWDSGRYWYEQQHYAMRGVAERTKTDFHVAVAVLAATSPRNPWDAWTNSKRRIRELAEKENISLEAAAKRLKADLFATPNIDVAEYLLQNWKSMRDKDFTLDADSIATLKKGLSETEKAAFEESLAGNKPIIRKISNLSGSTGAPTDLDYALAGLIMAGRAHEAQDHTTTYLSDMVATALAVIDGGPEKIDSTLTGPKVRSFYDNIAFFNESDAVTIDSIMAQLATGLPAWEAGELLKASQGTYVIDKFGNQVAEPYPVYAVIAEIVHEVTDRWNAAHPDDILSHTDVQAILWYVQRERDDILQLLNED